MAIILARDLLMLSPDMEAMEAMAAMVDIMVDMEVKVDTAIILERDLLMLSPDMEAMEAMVDIMVDMAITLARDLLRLSPDSDMEAMVDMEDIEDMAVMDTMVRFIVVAKQEFCCSIKF